MSHVDLDTLAGLVLDLDDVTDDVRRHVASCPDCAALATSLADVRRLAGAEALVPAPERVREQVLAQVRGPVAASQPHLAPPVPLPVGGPSLVAAGRPRRRARDVPAWTAGLAAGVALVAGLGLGRLAGGADAPEAVAPPAVTDTVVAAADLTALDSDASRGMASAVRSDDSITLRVSASELGDEDGFHEVWLINVDGSRMVALGVLASGNDGEFEVPMGLIEEGYRIVDISAEPDDGDPTHSGVSLARGELA